MAHESDDGQPLFDESDINRMRTHFGPDGPAVVAMGFMDAIASFDLAWHLWAPELRTEAAEHWVETNIAQLTAATRMDRDALIRSVDCDDPTASGARARAVWDAFVDTQLSAFDHEFPFAIEAYRDGRLGAASSTRLIAPDVERVLLVVGDPEKVVVYTEPTPVQAVSIDLRLTPVGWLVCSFGGQGHI